MSAPTNTETSAAAFLYACVVLSISLAAPSRPGIAESTADLGTGGTWSELVKLLPADDDSTETFGYSAALSGDTAIVGASGYAFVFVRSGSTWTQQALLRPNETTSMVTGSVAILGDTALVGAWSNEGPNSVSVFTRSGGEWTEEDALVASDWAQGDQFGSNVALCGDTALISSHRDDDNGNNSGSAYIFERTEGKWIEQAKLLAADGAAGDHFGQAVALSGDNALVGAYLDDDNGPSSGAAYVFTRSDEVWTEKAKLVPGDGHENDLFGVSVAIAGDTALVGSIWDDDLGLNSGSAYVFVRSGDTWIEKLKLVPGDGAALDHFGSSVALSDDLALVGARDDDGSADDSGSVYVFVKSGSSWVRSTKLTAGDGTEHDSLGSSVALSGDMALAVARGDSDSEVYVGSAYVFGRSLFEDSFESGDTSAWSQTVP